MREITVLSNEMNTAEHLNSKPYLKQVLLANMKAEQSEENDDESESKETGEAGESEFKPLSRESAKEVAHRLSAILKHPDTPKKFYWDIVNRLCDMRSLSPLGDAVDEDEPEEIEKILLAYYNGEVPEETEAKPIENYSLPELFSAAFNHPDMNADLRVDLWQSICDSGFADIDSPEYIGALLGMKAEKITSKKPKFPRKDLRISYNKGFQEAKEHLDVIIDESEHEDYFLNALISLFGIIQKQANLDKDDLLVNLQDYCFAHTLGFDRAADDYRAKLGFKTAESDEPNEPEKEPNENDPNNSESAGGSTSSPIIEIPQNLAFAENNQRL